MEKVIGTVTHYYDRAKVAVVRLEEALHLGDLVKFRARSGEFEQTIVQMQIDHKDISFAQAGTEVGIKTAEPIKPGAQVIKVA